MKHLIFSLGALVVIGSAASAQDFGRKWLDDATNELTRERGPLTPVPVNLDLYAGLMYAYDDNIFLKDQNEESSSILLPWARARLDYTAENWSATADLLATYKAYLQESDSSADEERFYGRIGYAGTRFSAQLVDIHRHESDPTGTVFNDRIERLLNHLHADMRFDITPAIAVEWNGDLTFLKMLDADFDNRDNISYRTDLGVAWRTPYEIDVVVHGGILGIAYNESPVPPDADGYYVRGGVRGDLLPRLKATILAGATSVESDPFPTGRVEEDDTVDAHVHLQYEATEQVTFFGQYSRQVTFVGGTDPYAIVNRIVFIGEVEATPMLDLRARFQYDDSDSALGEKRNFIYVGGSADYTLMEKLILSLGILHRSGEIERTPAFDWDNLVFTAGAAVRF